MHRQIRNLLFLSCPTSSHLTVGAFYFLRLFKNNSLNLINLPQDKIIQRDANINLTKL